MADTTADTIASRSPLALLALPFVPACHASAALDLTAHAPTLAASSLVLGILLVASRPRCAFLIAGVVVAGLGAGWMRGASVDPPRPGSLAALDASGVLAPWMGRAVEVDGRVRSLVLVRAGSASAEVELALDELRFRGKRIPCAGALRLVAPREAAGLLRETERLHAWVRLRPPTTWLNPGFEGMGRARHASGTRPLLVARVTSQRLMSSTGRKSWSLLALRERLALRLEIAFGARTQGLALARALVLGEQDALDEETLQGLRATGAAHVLSVSGLHVAVAAGFAAMLAAVLGAGVRGATLSGLLAAWSFAALAGLAVPVLRCAILVSVLGLGRLLARQASAWNALAAGALVTSWASPTEALGLGFILTFAAAAALIAIGPRIARHLPPGRTALMHALTQGVAASLAAWLALLPVSVLVFHQVSWLGVPANLVAVPIASVATIASLAAAGLILVHPALALPLAWLVDLCARVLSTSDEPWSRATTTVTAPALLFAGGYVVGMLAVLVTKGPRTRLVALAVWLACARELVSPDPPSWPAGLDARITVLDVGQGTCVLVETGRAEGGTWRALVDAGGAGGSRFDVGQRVVSRSLFALGVDHVDVVVASHADIDHRGGLPAIVRNFSPGAVLVPPAQGGASRDFDALRRASEAAGARFALAAAGDVLTPPDAWTTLRVAWPPRAPASRRGLSDNDGGLCLALTSGKRSLALLPADLERVGEQGLLDAGLGHARALVVAHHGSRSSSTSAFLTELRPSVAIVSAGRDNRFGHPHAEALERLASVGAATWSTRVDGAVSVEFFGGLTRVRCFASSREQVQIERRSHSPHGDGLGHEARGEDDKTKQAQDHAAPVERR